MVEIELKIDPEFQKKIPPLTDEEFEQLRENILSDGEVYEPIVVWEITIIDGHNRWKILQEHPEIPYHIRKMDFINKWEAFEWMFKKQLGRRNLTSEQRTDLIGRMYEARKKNAGGQIGNKNAEKRCGKNDHIVSNLDTTAKSVANEMGVGEKTVRLAEEYSRGIDAIRDVSDEAAATILRGNSGVKRRTVMDFPSLEPSAQEKLAKDILSGETKKNKKKLKTEEKSTTVSTKSKTSEPELEPKRVWDPVQRKSIDPLIEQINAEARDVDRILDYTIEDMLAEMQAISDEHTSQLQRVLEMRSDLLKSTAARDRVIAFLTESIAELEELRQLVQPHVA